MKTEIPSVIGRLLSEVSWEGRRVRIYRRGGRGLENVLTAEVMQALDFLPRKHFLGACLSALHDCPEVVSPRLVAEAEAVEFQLLPGPRHLTSVAGQRVEVQPDAILQSPSVHCVVEAKRIRSSSFQANQLAREYALVEQEAGAKQPLLMLLLGEPPPVLVQRRGRMEIEDAIRVGLAALIEQPEDYDKRQLSVAWLTWAEIGSILEGQRASFKAASRSVQGTVERIVGSAIGAIEWHS